MKHADAIKVHELHKKLQADFNAARLTTPNGWTPASIKPSYSYAAPRYFSLHPNTRPLLENFAMEDPHEGTVQIKDCVFPEENHLLGVQFLEESGLTFFGMAMGSTVFPVFVVIYVHNGEYQAYIPKSGNFYNEDFLCAFGAEMDSPFGPLSDPFDMKRAYIGLTDWNLTLRSLLEHGVRLEFGDYGNPIAEDTVDWKKIRQDLIENIKVI